VTYRDASLRRVVLSCLCLLATCALADAGDVEVWVEDTHADFADGALDASGQNLYGVVAGLAERPEIVGGLRIVSGQSLG
jgi:hypothetical protein